MICFWGKGEKVKAHYLPERLRMKVRTHDLLVEQRGKVPVRLLKISQLWKKRRE